MKAAIALCSVLLCCVAAADEKVRLEKRQFYVHKPPGWRKEKSSPLLMVFHGHGGKASNSEEQMHIAHATDPAGFLVAYMDGVDKGWDDGRYPDREGVDDLGYFDAALARLVSEFGADPARVFATGMSNGGGMSFRLACDRAGKIAGIAPVGMNFGEILSSRCKPSRPVPTLHIMGDDDRLVPFQGGEITGPLGFKKRGKVLSAQATAAFWEKVNGCAGKAIETSWDKDPKDATKVTHRISGDCRGARVEQYLIYGGGHTWPKGKQYLSKRLIGPVSEELDGSEAVVAFFASLGKK